MLERLVGRRRQVFTALASAAVLLCAGCGVAAVAAPLDPAADAVAGPLTPSELQEGLLAADDLPAGFVPLTAFADEDGGDLTFRGDEECRELTRLLNAEEVPGSLADAAVALSSGPDGGAAAEQLFALASSQTAARVVDGYGRAATRCTEIRLGVAGAGSETFDLHPLSLVGVAGNGPATAVRATSAGSSGGQDVIQVVAHAGPVVVVTTFMGVEPGDARQVTQLAVDKVRQRFGAGSGSLPSLAGLR